MSQNLTVVDRSVVEQTAQLTGWDVSRVESISNIICKGATPEEFQTFLMICSHTKLDPFLKQIYFIKRWDGRLKREVAQPQTSIEGLRLIADRSGRYAPGHSAKFYYDKNGNLESAEAFVKKQTKDGTWHEISALVYMNEYFQTTKEGRAMGLWGSKPRTMLAKVAESHALRKAFPAEMAGLYTREEMPHVDPDATQAVDIVSAPRIQEAPVTMDESSLSELNTLLEECSESLADDIKAKILNHYGVDELCMVPQSEFHKVSKKIAAKRDEENAYLHAKGE